MRHQRRILLITDYDRRHALAPRVRVEGVALFFHVLTLAGAGSFGDGFAEEGHELPDAAAGEAGVGAEIAFGAEFDGGLRFILQDLPEDQLCAHVREARWADADV